MVKFYVLMQSSIYLCKLIIGWRIVFIIYVNATSIPIKHVLPDSITGIANKKKLIRLMFPDFYVADIRKRKWNDNNDGAFRVLGLKPVPF